jgi:hypothetical protein
VSRLCCTAPLFKRGLHSITRSLANGFNSLASLRLTKAVGHRLKFLLNRASLHHHQNNWPLLRESLYFQSRDLAALANKESNEN